MRDEEFVRTHMGNKAKRLSEDQISQIAERIGEQLKQERGSTTSGVERSTGYRPNRAGRTSAYIVGAASGLALAIAAPLLRPLVRSAIKGGLVAGRYARQAGSNIKEQFEDIASEAEAEIDREKGKSEEEV